VPDLAGLGTQAPQRPYQSPAYRRAFVGPSRCGDLADFLSRTPWFLALQHDERGLRAVVEDLFDQLGRDGVVYAEIRFAPLQHTQRDEAGHPLAPHVPAFRWAAERGRVTPVPAALCAGG
jgi:Adenosine deaminase